MLASYATDPLDADTDHDGLPDAFERAYSLDPNDDGSIDPVNGAYGDLDADGMYNLEEYWYGSNPASSDSDADGLTDSEEAYSTFSDPIVADSDGDGISDAQEDYDRDGLTNFAELRVHHTQPWIADTDGDTLRDGWELANGLDPLVYNSTTDPDGDGLTNAQEQLLGLAPLDSDTDNDGTLDGAEDPDGDTLTNHAELNIYQTNPLQADTDTDGLSDAAEINTHLIIPTNHDTDGDGLPDGWEVQHALNPKDANGINGSTGDPDTDGLNNFHEWLNGCDPNDADSDNDGTDELTEITQGSDPNDPTDGGDPPPTNQLLDVPVTVSDPSDSHSEKWKLTIKGLGPDDHRTISLASPGYGQQATATLKLRKWNRYEISVSHLGTEPTYLEENENKPDYDWEATVDSKPTSVAAEQTEDEPGVNNFFMVKDHWLVDNREAVFTTEKHGDDDDIVSGKKAFLVPAAIKDNTDATGVDNVSITANPADTGYQAKSWIMAPAGGTVVVNGVSFPLTNDMHFNIPVEPATDLEITCPNATPNLMSPDTTSLSNADPPPVVTWAGTCSEPPDNTPVFKIGIAKEEVDLPVRVKTMKKRTVSVAVHQVASVVPGRPNDPPNLMPDKVQIETELNRIFGHQINAYFVATILPPENIALDIADAATSFPGFTFGAGTPPPTPGNRVLNFTDWEAGEVQTLTANRSAAFDIHVFIFGGATPIVSYKMSGADPSVFVLDGQAIGRANTGVGKNYCIVDGDRDTQTFDLDGNPTGFYLTEDERSIPGILQTIAHEIGHIVFGERGGHPDDDEGDAPLVGTDRTKRLMCSGPRCSITDSKLLVKAEWGWAEEWLKARPNGDN